LFLFIRENFAEKNKGDIQVRKKEREGKSTPFAPPSPSAMACWSIPESATAKPGVLERLGTALNSADLQSHDEVVGAVDLIAAMAYTQTNASAAEHVALEAAEIDPRTELASLLVRLKYAGDNSVGERVAIKLEHWVIHQRAFRKWKIKPGQSRQLHCFVRTALEEWLFPVCTECHGRELVGLEREELVEKRLRCTRCRGKGTLHETPRYSDRSPTRLGVKVRKDCPQCGGCGWRTHLRSRQRAKTDTCARCKGTGQRIPGDMERAMAIGIEVRIYQRDWAKRFTWLATGLDKIDHTQKRSLQSWLRSGINRA